MKKVTVWINFVSEIEIRKFRRILWKGRYQEERMGMRKRDKGSDYMRGEAKRITGGFGDKRKNYSITFKGKIILSFSMWRSHCKVGDLAKRSRIKKEKLRVGQI